MTTSRIEHQTDDSISERYYQLGVQYFDENKWQEAQAFFNLTLSLKPNNIDAIYMRGRTHLHLNDRNEAKKDFKKIIELEPFNQHAHFLHGLSLLQLHDYEAALTELKECLRLKPDDPSASIYQGWSLLNLQKYDEALLSFKKAIKLSPTSYHFYHYGRALYSMNFIEKAIENFDECLARNPTYFYAYFRKGQILNGLKRKEEAEISFRACVKVDPNRPITWYLYALGLFLLEKYHQCLFACEESLKRRIDFSSAIILKKETEAKLKSLNDYTKEKYIMLNRIEQISMLNLQAKITEQAKKLSDLQIKHSSEIEKLNSEINDLRNRLKSVEEHEIKLNQLNTKHLEEAKTLNNIIANLKRQGKIVEAHNTKILNLQNKNKNLEMEMAQLKNQQLTKQQVLDEVLLDESIKGNLKGIESAIDLGATITSKNKDGLSALHLTAFNGQQEAAKLLLNKALEKNEAFNLFITPDTFGFTPMQQAAKAENLELLAWFYEQGKQIPEFYNDPIEFDKVYDISTEKVKKYLANIKLLDGTKTGNVAHVLDALSKGADINFIGHDGTPLHVAIFCKHKEIIQLLLERGADPTILHFRETALDMAITLNNQHLISLISTPFLIFATINNNIPDMEKALVYGANLIGKDSQGQTALHKAIDRNNLQAIKFLLKQHVLLGHDIQISDGKEITPYQLAKKLNQTVTTDKSKKIIETDYYLSTRYFKYLEQHKQGHSLYKSTFSLFERQAFSPTADNMQIPSVTNEGNKMRK